MFNLNSLVLFHLRQFVGVDIFRKYERQMLKVYRRARRHRMTHKENLKKKNLMTLLNPRNPGYILQR